MRPESACTYVRTYDLELRQRAQAALCYIRYTATYLYFLRGWVLSVEIIFSIWQFFALFFCFPKYVKQQLKNGKKKKRALSQT